MDTLPLFRHPDLCCTFVEPLCFGFLFGAVAKSDGVDESIPVLYNTGLGLGLVNTMCFGFVFGAATKRPPSAWRPFPLFRNLCVGRNLVDSLLFLIFVWARDSGGAYGL
jgi:hypothetical protein